MRIRRSTRYQGCCQAGSLAGLPVPVLPGSSLASTLVQRAVMALNLFNAGLLPGAEVLRAAEWPDPEGTYKQALEQRALTAQGAGQRPPKPVRLPGRGWRGCSPGYSGRGGMRCQRRSRSALRSSRLSARWNRQPKSPSIRRLAPIAVSCRRKPPAW
jgi:hypothetical protein